MSVLEKPSIMQNVLRRATLVTVLLLVGASYPASIVALGQERTIELGNVILLSLACGIVVAYALPAYRAFRYALVDGAAILSAGIFSSWLAVAVARSGSIIWRVLDQPVDWLNSGWWGCHLAFSAMGAMCHLIAPEAVAGRVPTRYWVKIGLMVAVSVFFASGLAMLSFPD